MLSEHLEQLAVMGLPVHWNPDYANWLLHNMRQGRGAHVVTLNAEMSMQADRNAILRKIIQSAELVIPDGAGIVLYFRLKGKRIQRCPGIELAAELIQRSRPAESVFFYGGAPGVAEAAVQAWQQRSPDLAIAGVQHGYLKPEQQPAFQQRLQELQPQLIFVGLGVPRQEFWIAEHRHLCPQATWVGVGGSFDIWSGTKTRAPAIFRKNHLEWLYRLYQEPWRWRRMLSLPQFAWRALTYPQS
ncbi:WecB/TagA/CpsF family glycosyltransferase [Sphaerothrix gracilis]|uniref:WecB/TagA/CpsF family glycosyltransferase n=1 Tax=Sphaerothrix gracilis TaxID=3151835 RepID=UPI0031FC31F8